MKYQIYFLGKIRNTSSVSLSFAELAQRVVKVNVMFSLWPYL